MAWITLIVLYSLYELMWVLVPAGIGFMIGGWEIMFIFCVIPIARLMFKYLEHN
jgi:hypothetical protein